MDNKPDAYVIIAELEDNTFRVITEKLNVREAREKLEIVQLKIRDKMFHGVVNAFMYNLKEQYVDA
jgi:hypothetical protein